MFEFLADDSDQHVNRDGDPYLGLHGVLAGAKEGLDAQVLLDLFEEQLTFIRLKSLAQFGHLPKYDGQSSRAWLYGKLFVALLTQKLIRTGRELSPWGYILQANASTQ